MRFSYRDHRFLKQITKLEANQIHKICICVKLHVVVTGNAKRLKWSGRTSFTCMYNEWNISEENFFIDSVSHNDSVSHRRKSCVGSYSERCSRDGFFVDFAEIRCTGIKFILNTFQSRCDECSVGK